MNTPSIERDERTVAVENASYRWGYLCTSFGVLALVAYRSFARNEANWDLVALVIFGGFVPILYQAFNRVLTPRWARTQIVALIAAAIVAAIVMFLRRG